MADSQNGRMPATDPWAVKKHGVLLPTPEANKPAPPDHGHHGQHDRHDQGVRPTDARQQTTPTLAIAPEPPASSVAQTGRFQLAPRTADKRAAPDDDWTSEASEGSIPAPVQTAPRSPWFRIVLLLLMLALLSAVAFWSPATLQTLAATTMELVLSTDIPESRTAPGPGPLVGQLDATSTPSGIDLYVDGELHGVTPAKLVLNAGSHELTFVSPVGKVRRRVRVSPGHRTLFSEAIFPGSLVITSAVGVEIRIDGRAVARSAGHELTLAPGSYQVELLNPDDTRTTQTVEILPGQVTTLGPAKE